MKLTRRELAAALTATAARAQAPGPASPSGELEAARDRVKSMIARLSGQPVPMTTEPAFQFKA